MRRYDSVLASPAMVAATACETFPRVSQVAMLALSISLLALDARPAFAQATEQATVDSQSASQPSGDAVQAGDIVVTAQKREQRANDVGLTINVIGAEELKAAGVTDPAALVRVTPGLDVGQTQNGSPLYSIRGVNLNSGAVSGAPTVTAYLDEAPLPYPIMWGGLLLDVGHVEILKGPQGTLFGQNATGGSISVIAAKPTTELAAGGQIDLDEFGRVQAQGYVSGGLSDTLRARVAVAADEGGAWQKGFVTTRREIGKYDQLSGRVLIEWTPSADLKFFANINGTRNTGEAQAFQLHEYNPLNPAAGTPAFNQFIATSARQAETTRPLTLDNYTWQTALRGEWSFAPNATLISVTNLVKARVLQATDLDGTSLLAFQSDRLARAKAFTQELRIAGELPDTELHYIVGGYYQKDDLLDATDLSTGAGLSSTPPGLGINGRFPQTNRALAVFANVDYEIVPGLTLTGGARYTKSRQTVKGCTSPGNAFTATVFARAIGQCLTRNDTLPPTDSGFLQPITADFKQSQEEDNVSWRAGVNYKPNRDLLFYGLISRGYKAGSFNVGIPFVVSALNPAKQEELTAYEAGIKATLFERIVNFNLSAFHYDYRDKQFQTYIPSPFGALVVLTNIPKSTVSGLDAELAVNLKDVKLNAGLTYIDTRVGSFRTFDIGLNTVDVTGNRFNLAPRLSATFGASYRPRLTRDLRGLLSLDGLYHSSTNSDLVQTANLKVPAYTVLDALVGIESDKGWRANLWVRNLTDKYYAATTAAAADFSLWLAGRPRTIGVTFGYDLR